METWRLGATSGPLFRWSSAWIACVVRAKVRTDGSTTTSSPFAKGGMVAVLLDSTRLCLLVGSCNGRKVGIVFHVVQMSGHAPQNDKTFV